MKIENQISITMENCDSEAFLDFCKFRNQIAEVRPSEPPEALGVPGLVEFFIEIGPLIVMGIELVKFLVEFLKDWESRNAGNIVSIKIGEEEIVVKGRGIKEIETDIARIKFR